LVLKPTGIVAGEFYRLAYFTSSNDLWNGFKYFDTIAGKMGLKSVDKGVEGLKHKITIV